MSQRVDCGPTKPIFEKHKLLEGWNVYVNASVRWGDMDAYGHLNNTAYFRLFEDVRLHYLDQLKLKASTNLENMGIVVAAASAKFKMPLVYPDPIQVGCKITILDEDRITMMYRIVAVEKDRVACVGDSLLVAVDLRTMEKLKVPADVLTIIREVEGNPQL